MLGLWLGHSDARTLGLLSFCVLSYSLLPPGAANAGFMNISKVGPYEEKLITRPPFGLGSCEEAPVCEPGGELEEDAGDLHARGRGVVSGVMGRKGGRRDIP